MMPHKFAQMAFTETVRQFQKEQNSRNGYARMDEGEDYNFLLSENEAAFIQQRDSFYMASVSETGWPYVQHRGGPKGFLKILDAKTLGFADYNGNRQYISAGNFRGNDRVSLFFMDYPNQRRLKLMGRIEQVAESDWETLAKLEDETYGAMVERGFIIHVEAFDWNCPQHITPRYSEADVKKALHTITQENIALQQALQSAETSSLNSQEPVQVLGSGELPLVISAIRQLTPDIRSFELRHLNGDALPPFKAGAHLKIPVRLNDGRDETRSYSIASDPANRFLYEIAILNEPEGNGGSASAHKLFQLGTQLNCPNPENFFTLNSDEQNIILIAGGIGITPIKAMAHTLSKIGNFQLHYAGKSRSQMAYADTIGALFPNQLRLYTSDQNNRMNVDHILDSAPKESLFYICGPLRLIDDVRSLAKSKGISADKIQYELFETKIEANARPLTVELARSGNIIKVAADQTILDALLENGIELPFSCKTGQCKSCVTTVISGEPAHQDHCLTPYERDAQKRMCLCVSRAKGDILKLDI